jgi:hypothetical protein
MRRARSHDGNGIVGDAAGTPAGVREALNGATNVA